VIAMMLGIDVDAEVYKTLSARRSSENEAINDVLRTLLNLGAATAFSFVLSQPKLPVSSTNARPRQAPKAKGMIGRIAVLGSTGKIGDKIVDEAIRRGIAVTAIARDPAKLKPRDGMAVKAGDANEPGSLGEACAGADALVVAVKWPGIEPARLLDGIRKTGVKRAIFVLGTGTSVREDGRRQFIHAAEAAGIPVPPSVPAMRVLDTLVGSTGFDWTAITCPQDIASGERTASFRVGDARMIVDQDGTSRISEQDFAIAIIDELEEPHKVRQQFCAAY
jgi:putative NADH-flavin reductase